MSPRRLLAPCLAALLITWAVPLRAAPPPGAGSRGPPPPIPRTYRFENDVLTELAEDRDRDGRPDAWQSFRRADLVRLELDRDRDGAPDWREAWEPDPNRPPELQTVFIEGRWRITPYNVLKSIHGIAPSPGFYHGKAEKLVAGRWVDTFDDVQILTYGLDHDERNTNITRHSARWRFDAGKPVEVTVTGEKHYTRITWKDARPTSYVDGVDKDHPRCIEQYRDGFWTTRSYFDDAGNPTTRLTGGGAEPRWEWFKDGQWTGDHEETHRDSHGRLTYRTVYRDGRQSLHEMFEPNAGGQLIRRRRHDPDGSWVEEQADRHGHVYLRSRYAKDGTPRGTEKLVAGQWLRDFDDNPTGNPMTYRDGRLVRLEFRGDIADDGRRVAVFHPDGREEWGDGKVTRYWYAHSQKPGQMRRRTHESRDLDGDGKPDLTVDYERLTVEQPVTAR